MDLRCVFFFFNDTATTEIYTLSLHDALPICVVREPHQALARLRRHPDPLRPGLRRDRKSTRLNSSHSQISYAVFCLKKKNAPSLHRDATPATPPHHSEHAHRARGSPSTINGP